MAEETGVGRVIGVANRVTAPADVMGLAQELGLAEMAAVPEDAAVLEADRRGIAAFEAAPDSTAIVAVGHLARRVRTKRDEL